MQNSRYTKIRCLVECPTTDYSHKTSMQNSRYTKEVCLVHLPTIDYSHKNIKINTDLCKVYSTWILHAAYQVSRPLNICFWRKRFKSLPYMSTATILVMWQGPFTQNSILHSGWICSVASVVWKRVDRRHITLMNEFRDENFPLFRGFPLFV